MFPPPGLNFRVIFIKNYELPIQQKFSAESESAEAEDSPNLMHVSIAEQFNTTTWK